MKKSNIIDAFMRSVSLRYLIKKNKEFSSERNHRLAVFANDWIGAKIFLDGIYEREQLNIVTEICTKLDLLREGSVAIDIGANIGNHSIYLSNIFDQVISFEANPNTFKLLEYNAGFLENITVCNKGVGNKNETLLMHESKVNWGASSIVYNNEVGDSITVEVSPLDELVSGEKVDLIKIDVEGMEFDVLQGAERIIDRYQPIIVFEQHESEFMSDKNHTLSTELLKDKGYNFAWLEDKYAGGGLLSRRINKLLGILKNEKGDFKLAYSDVIPRETHTLLVAFPSKFSERIAELV